MNIPKNGPATLWAKVRKLDNGCWEWAGSKCTRGYGVMSLNNRQQSTHRLAWMFIHGPIPAGMVICHHCDNPPCCNPDHLYLGTKLDNAWDRKLRGLSVATRKDRLATERAERALRECLKRAENELEEACGMLVGDIVDNPTAIRCRINDVQEVIQRIRCDLLAPIAPISISRTRKDR